MDATGNQQPIRKPCTRSRDWGWQMLGRSELVHACSPCAPPHPCATRPRQGMIYACYIKCILFLSGGSVSFNVSETTSPVHHSTAHSSSCAACEDSTGMVLARASKSQDEVLKSILPVVDPDKAEKDAGDSDAKESRGFLSPEMAASPLISGSIYCAVSAAMVLLNKYALSGFEFTSPNTLLLFQCASAIIFVKAAEVMGVWRVEKLRWDVVRVRFGNRLLRKTRLAI